MGVGAFSVVPPHRRRPDREPVGQHREVSVTRHEDRPLRNSGTAAASPGPGHASARAEDRPGAGGAGDRDDGTPSRPSRTAIHDGYTPSRRMASG